MAPFGFPSDRIQVWLSLRRGHGVRASEETVDPNTGEVESTVRPVLPSHYKCPLSGAALPVENPSVWVYPGGDQ